MTDNGAKRIALERSRQKDLGWDEAHDAHHTKGELLLAAECYLQAARVAKSNYSVKEWYDQDRNGNLLAPFDWPWEREAWRPSEDPIRNLEKAGALLAAEIDVLQKEKINDMV